MEQLSEAVRWLEADYDRWDQRWFATPLSVDLEGGTWYTRAQGPHHGESSGRYYSGDGPGYHQSMIKIKDDTPDCTDEEATQRWRCDNCPDKHRCDFCDARISHSASGRCLSCYMQSDDTISRLRHVRAVHMNRVRVGACAARIGASLQASWSAPSPKPAPARVSNVRGPRPSAMITANFTPGGAT